MLTPRQPKSIRKSRASVYSQEYAESKGLRLISSQQYQQEFHVTRQTVSRRIRKREIKAFKQGKYWFILV